MKLLCLVTICIVIACGDTEKTNKKNIPVVVKILPSTQYKAPAFKTMKACIIRKKQVLSTRYKPAFTAYDISQLESQFVAIVVDSILPYWYGTQWNFNGTTQTPGESSIACGYFITTVLQDAGLPLNRVKLAQCASQQMIEKLVTVNKKKIFSNVPLPAFLDYVMQQGFGLYIVGLDSHVGFLYNDGSEIYFIHAKWANPKAVVKEVASQSGVLYYSAYKIVGKISDDPALMKKWLVPSS